MLCPSCDGHFTPPGPCRNLDGGEPCGYREPDRPEPKRSGPRRRPPVSLPDRHALAGMADAQVAGHQSGIALARRALAEAEFRKQLPERIRDRVLSGRQVVDVDTGDRL